MIEKFPLWEGEVPYYNPEINQDNPYVADYHLENGRDDNPCVLVIPGGAYGCVCTDHEGDKVCRFLNDNGISAFYLSYRVAPYNHPVPETDAKRAMRYIRYHSKRFGIDPHKIAVMGFSAGGHLCCMTALRFDYGLNCGDEIDRVSSRPDLAAPIYAVSTLSFKCTHRGTRQNLLGEPADDILAYKLSSENIIRDDAPPFFIFHTATDQLVPLECSLRLCSALKKKEIPCEFHVFPEGLHGVGIGTDTPLANQWPHLFVNFLKYFFKESDGLNL